VKYDAAARRRRRRSAWPLIDSLYAARTSAPGARLLRSFSESPRIFRASEVGGARGYGRRSARGERLFTRARACVYMCV
jgi:hypothetical protein